MKLAKTKLGQKQNADSSTRKGSYWITTFGCQMNKADSERMSGILEEMGYLQAKSEFEADLVLYNTCTIRDKRERVVADFIAGMTDRYAINLHKKII